jgi:hypothetical protein
MMQSPFDRTLREIILRFRRLDPETASGASGILSTTKKLRLADVEKIREFIIVNEPDLVDDQTLRI